MRKETILGWMVLFLMVCSLAVLTFYIGLYASQPPAPPSRVLPAFAPLSLVLGSDILGILSQNGILFFNEFASYGHEVDMRFVGNTPLLETLEAMVGQAHVSNEPGRELVFTDPIGVNYANIMIMTG